MKQKVLIVETDITLEWHWQVLRCPSSHSSFCSVSLKQCMNEEKYSDLRLLLFLATDRLHILMT